MSGPLGRSKGTSPRARLPEPAGHRSLTGCRPRFDSDPALRRVGCKKGTGRVWAHAGGTVLLRNVPTCETADAPGTFTAITRALTLVIACVRTACDAASPLRSAIPTARPIMPGKFRMDFRTLVGHVPKSIFLFARFVDTGVDPNLMISSS